MEVREGTSTYVTLTSCLRATREPRDSILLRWNPVEYRHRSRRFPRLLLGCLSLLFWPFGLSLALSLCVPDKQGLRLRLKTVKEHPKRVTVGFLRTDLIYGATETALAGPSTTTISSFLRRVLLLFFKPSCSTVV